MCEAFLNVHGVDVEVAQHGIGFPPSKELDGVLVDVSTEQGSGSAEAEAAGTDQCWVHTSLVLEASGCVSECVGDVFGFGVAAVARCIVVCTDGGVVGHVTTADVHDETCQGLDRAKEGVRGSPVRNTLTTDGLLLVSETEARKGDLW